MITNTATMQGIWHYVNLNTLSDQLPALPEPVAQVAPAAVDDLANSIDLHPLRY
jgi:hypothetical protein